MADSTNHLGLDKYQITVIKSNFNSTKPLRKMVEKVDEKISKAQAVLDKTIAAAQKKYQEAVGDIQGEAQVYKDQIALLDNFSIETTTKTCGIGLTSEQVVKFLDDKEAFEAYKASLNQAGAGCGQAETTEPETQEEAKENTEGEAKEISDNEAENLPWNNNN